MPVRSLDSSILRWPRPAEVEPAVRELALRLADSHSELICLGYFGSYARGDWGVGSDVDLIAIVSHSTAPFVERGRAFDASRLPVPADLLVYTADEWQALLAEENAFAGTVQREVRWVFERRPPASLEWLPTP